MAITGPFFVAKMLGIFSWNLSKLFQLRELKHSCSQCLLGFMFGQIIGYFKIVGCVTKVSQINEVLLIEENRL